MGVSAVPGSGKTATLSCLAAQLVRDRIRGEEEVLIVTFMNSAVDAFSRRIRGFLDDAGLLPGVGYRVRTLHGLGNDIVRERPGLVGLSEDFTILDERVSSQVLDEVVVHWMRAHPGGLQDFLSGEVTDGRRAWVEREGWPNTVRETARAFIRRAKDLLLSPEEVHLRLGDAEWALCRAGAEVYADYQRALAHRGAVDFDDLIRLAVEALRSDAGLLDRMRRRWPYVLEDEAQDSSGLQEQILRLLTEGGNWVRVGDPNQAINTTFTTADVRFLGRFLEEPDTQRRELLHSGRSTRRIIDVANRLIDWTVSGHPNPTVRLRAFRPQHIAPVPPTPEDAGWPLNPEDLPDHRVVFHGRAYTPDQELSAVVDSLARWMPGHGDRTVAVLTPDNRRGARVAEALKRRKIDYDELLRSTAAVRQAAERVTRVLRYLSDPLSGPLLAQLYEVWARTGPEAGEGVDEERARNIAGLRRCKGVEALLWPSEEGERHPSAPLRSAQEATGERPSPRQATPSTPLPYTGEGKPSEARWGEGGLHLTPDEEIPESLTGFLEVVRRWLEASALPVDQLVLTVAQDLFRGEDPGAVARDLAVAHKIASLLRGVAEQNPGWRLQEMAGEVERIADNERQFLGFDEDEAGYTPTPGRVTVATMHKAKGLEWDRVYLMGVNTYDFPSADSGDTYRGERWFIRDNLDLRVEMIAQLEALSRGGASPVEGDASQEERLRYAEERLRLLYVGITRGRREVIATYNVGLRVEDPKPAALPFIALRGFVENL